MLLADCLFEFSKLHPRVKDNVLIDNNGQSFFNRQVVFDANPINFGFELLWPHKVIAIRLHK
jgi:hypothetical protein